MKRALLIFAHLFTTLFVGAQTDTLQLKFTGFSEGSGESQYNVLLDSTYFEIEQLSFLRVLKLGWNEERAETLTEGKTYAFLIQRKYEEAMGCNGDQLLTIRSQRVQTDPGTLFGSNYLEVSKENAWKSRCHLISIEYYYVSEIIELVGQNYTQRNATEILRLKESDLRESFFATLDSVRKFQYPNGNQGDSIHVDINPDYLLRFINEIDSIQFAKTHQFSHEFDFGIAPAGFSDTMKCLDRIELEYVQEGNRYIMKIFNSFSTESEWCTESMVIYSFRIEGDNIVRFWRNEAG